MKKVILLSRGKSVVDPYGTNLVLNGEFTTNTDDWIASDSTLASVSGQLEITETAQNANAKQYITTEVGSDYFVEVDVAQGTGSDFSIRFGAWIRNAATDWGTITYTYTATGTSTTLMLYGDYSDATSHTTYYDNVRVRKLI